MLKGRQGFQAKFFIAYFAELPLLEMIICKHKNVINNAIAAEKKVKNKKIA